MKNAEQLELFLAWVDEHFIVFGAGDYMSIDSDKEYNIKEIVQLYLQGN